MEIKQDSAHLKDKGGGTWVLPLIRLINPPAGFFIFYHRPSRKIPGCFRWFLMFKVTRSGQCVASLVPHWSGVHGSRLESCEATQPKFEGVDVSLGVTERLGFIPRVSCLANSSWSIGLFLGLWALKKQKKTLRLTMINIYVHQDPFSSKILKVWQSQRIKKNPTWPLVCCYSK